MWLACTRWREYAIKDPKKNMNMATQSPVAITKEGHPEKGLQEEPKVHSGRQPLAIKTVGNRITLAQEEEGIEKYGRSQLRIVTSTAYVHQPRGVLSNKTISMHDCWAQGPRSKRRRKTQSRREDTSDLDNLRVTTRDSAQENKSHIRPDTPKLSVRAN